MRRMILDESPNKKQKTDVMGSLEGFNAANFDTDTAMLNKGSPDSLLICNYY